MNIRNLTPTMEFLYDGQWYIHDGETMKCCTHYDNICWVEIWWLGVNQKSHLLLDKTDEYSATLRDGSKVIMYLDENCKLRFN